LPNILWVEKNRVQTRKNNIPVIALNYTVDVESGNGYISKLALSSSYMCL